MKLDMNDLRSALPGEPESCRAALLQAARSVEEEKPMKRFTLRAALAAALILAAMMAAAVAATSGGLMNWFQNAYQATLPQSVQEALNATEKTSLETERITFTVSELLCDGKIAYMTAEAQLKDKGRAILYPDTRDPMDRIGAQLAQTLNHPGVTAESTYADAARATGLPLYCVNAWLETEDDARIDSEMMDGSLLEDGGVMLVLMLYFRDELNADDLPVTITAQVSEVDLDTLEFVPNSRERAAVRRTISIHGVRAERSYAPQGDATLSGCFTLTGVDTKQTGAGVYVTVKARTDAPMTAQEILETGFIWDVLDAQGNPFPIGLSLTGEYLDENGQPLEWISGEKLEGVQYLLMISVDELPESFIVTDEKAKVVVR